VDVQDEIRPEAKEVIAWFKRNKIKQSCSAVTAKKNVWTLPNYLT
jgi:hypothetical protein